MVRRVYLEIEAWDDMDKRAYLADALANDGITEEEYYKILEIVSL